MQKKLIYFSMTQMCGMQRRQLLKSFKPEPKVKNVIGSFKGRILIWTKINRIRSILSHFVILLLFLSFIYLNLSCLFLFSFLPYLSEITIFSHCKIYTVTNMVHCKITINTSLFLLPEHRRRINTEEKEKVVAGCCLGGLLECRTSHLSARIIWKKLLEEHSFWEGGVLVWTGRSFIFLKHPLRQVSVLLFINFFKSSWLVLNL